MKRDEPPRSRRPFRDTVITYGLLAIVIVLAGTVTGGGVARTILAAAAFFIAATGWSWWRYRRRVGQGRGG